MKNISQKFLIALLVFFIGLLAGHFLHGSKEDKNMKEIYSLNRGTYNSIYPDIQGYITLTIDGIDYVLYEESEVLDKGKYSYVSHNSFQFEGEKFDFQMNYMSGAYICSFDNKNNYPHFVLKYQSSAVVIYKNEENK